jgi:hypothetical protein
MPSLDEGVSASSVERVLDTTYTRMSSKLARDSTSYMAGYMLLRELNDNTEWEVLGLEAV